MIGLPAALLGLFAMFRLGLYRRQQSTLLRQCEHPSRRAACEAALERASRLLRAELTRAFVATLLLILIAVCAFIGSYGTTLTVAVASASYLAEAVIAARATASGLRGKGAALLLGAGIAAVVAWGAVLAIARLPWAGWLLATISMVVLAIGVYQACDWLWLRPRREVRVPLADETVVRRMQALARQCGVDGAAFLVVEGDPRTVNARAESDPRGRRVVLWPALLQRLGPAHLDAVISHELGHLALRHLRGRFLNFAILAGVAVVMASLVSAGVWAPGGIQAGLHIAMVVVLLPLILSGLRGWTLALYRRQEIEADDFVRETGRGTLLAEALLRLSPSAMDEPRSDPWHHRAYDSHPPIELRLAHLRAAG